MKLRNENPPNNWIKPMSCLPRPTISTKRSSFGWKESNSLCNLAFGCKHTFHKNFTRSQRAMEDILMRHRVQQRQNATRRYLTRFRPFSRLNFPEKIFFLTLLSVTFFLMTFIIRKYKRGNYLSAMIYFLNN